MEEDEMILRIQHLTSNLLPNPVEKQSRWKEKNYIMSQLRGEIPVENVEDDGYIHISHLGTGTFDVNDILKDFDQTTTIDGKTKIGDIEINGELVKTTYAHVGKVADMVYLGRYKRYTGPVKKWCFTHTTEYGFATINRGRGFNILYSSNYVTSKGVIAVLNLDKHPEIELWSNISDKYGNTVFCFKHNLIDFFDEYIYDDIYLENCVKEFQKTHSQNINVLQYKFHISENDAIKRCKKLCYIRVGKKMMNIYNIERKPPKLDINL